MAWWQEALRGGLTGLGSYLAAHVLLCLVPAFFIAGALAALVPKEAITRYLGSKARRPVAYGAAVAAGSTLAVCSCTIVPLFAGIYRKGAGLGPAITFLFFAPAANVMAIAYTGAALGIDLAIARLVLSLLFSIAIGITMARLFRREESVRAAARDTGFAAGEPLRGDVVLLVALLFALLIAGTLQVGWLSGSLASGSFDAPAAARVERWLARVLPFDAARQEEGVGVHGALKIALLALLAPLAWRGLDHVDAKATRATTLALGALVVTLLVASLRIVVAGERLEVHLVGRTLAIAGGLAALLFVARRRLGDLRTRQWLWESWRFAKQIVPILLIGVFCVGAVRGFVKPEWIRAVAGENTLLGNLAGVGFGVLMYFPTLVEVPIAQLFLSLGMHRGPLLAYLMADPELSLQSILITSAILGRKKTWTYVALVAAAATASGWIYGRVLGG